MREAKPAHTEGEGGPAFACAAENGHQPGMSLRDYFAGQVLASGAFYTRPVGAVEWQADIAWCAYSIADAMIAERARATGSQT